MRYKVPCDRSRPSHPDTNNANSSVNLMRKRIAGPIIALAVIAAISVCAPVRAQSIKDLMGRAQSQSDRRAVEDLIKRLQGDRPASEPQHKPTPAEPQPQSESQSQPQPPASLANPATTEPSVPPATQPVTETASPVQVQAPTATETAKTPDTKPTTEQTTLQTPETQQPADTASEMGGTTGEDIAKKTPDVQQPKSPVDQAKPATTEPQAPAIASPAPSTGTPQITETPTSATPPTATTTTTATPATTAKPATSISEPAKPQAVSVQPNVEPVSTEPTKPQHLNVPTPALSYPDQAPSVPAPKTAVIPDTPPASAKPSPSAPPVSAPTTTPATTAAPKAPVRPPTPKQPAPSAPVLVKPRPAPDVPKDAVDIASKRKLPTVDIEIYFDFNRSRISKRALATLNILGRALTDPRLAGATFLIAGHTDAKGRLAYNQRLSEQRAASVRTYLIKNFGIPEERLISKGYGETRLKDPEHPTALKNRRVQIINWTSELTR